MPESNNVTIFHRKWIQNNFASLQAGHPVGDYEDYVTIRAPGQPKQEVDRKVKPEDTVEYSRQWMLYQNGLEQTAEGTPLEQWPMMSPNDILMLKSHGIHTIEACANLSDAAVVEVGHGARKFQQTATYFLQELGSVSSNAALRTDNDALRVANQALERELGECHNMIAELVALSEQPAAPPEPVSVPAPVVQPEPAPVATNSIYPDFAAAPDPAPVVPAPPMVGIPPPPAAVAPQPEPEFSAAPEFVPYAPHEATAGVPHEPIPEPALPAPPVASVPNDVPEHMIGNTPDKREMTQKQLDILAKGRAVLKAKRAAAAAAELVKQQG